MGTRKAAESQREPPWPLGQGQTRAGVAETAPGGPIFTALPFRVGDRVRVTVQDEWRSLLVRQRRAELLELELKPSRVLAREKGADMFLFSMWVWQFC